MEEGYPELVAGTEYTGAFDAYHKLTDITLDAPRSQHGALINRLKERFGEEHFRTYEESVERTFSYVTGTIDALKIIFIVIMIFVLALNTTLYTTVDLTAETPGIAILKCVGFSEKDIRKWQMIRMLIIMTAAILLGYLVEFTLVDRVAGKVFETFGNTGKHLIPDPLEAFVIIPAMIILIGAIVMRICVTKIKSINLWNIRED
jgi:cell division protein FtsX